MTWLTMLVEQMRFGLWRPLSDAADRWLETWTAEMAQLSDLQLKAGHQFDEAEQWHGLRGELFGKPLGISAIWAIRDYLWSLTFEDRLVIKDRRAKLADTWRPLLQNALHELDDLSASRPMLFLQLLRSLEWTGFGYLSSPLSEAGPEQQRRILRHAIERILSLHPDEAREQIASLCHRQLLSVDEFCTLANQHAPAWDWIGHVQFLTDRASKDTALHCLCHLMRTVAFEESDTETF